jgi:hypothetical protein
MREPSRRAVKNLRVAGDGRRSRGARLGHGADFVCSRGRLGAAARLGARAQSHGRQRRAGFPAWFGGFGRA